MALKSAITEENFILWLSEIIQILIFHDMFTLPHKPIHKTITVTPQGEQILSFPPHLQIAEIW